MSDYSALMSARLPKTGQPYIIRRLGEEDIFAVTGLHKIILDNLRPGQECFIHRKKTSDFMRILENPNQLFIGAFCENELIGYASANFINRDNAEDILPGFALDYEPAKIAVLEQASVNPAYRGNNLASVMNALRQKVAYREYGRRYAVTMVDIKNFYSYRNGFKNGMCVTQAAVDPADGGHVVYMAKEIGRETRFNISCIPQELSYAEMDIAKVNALIREGYVARGYDDARQKVLFGKTNDFKYKIRGAKLKTAALTPVIFSKTAHQEAK